MRVPDNLTSVLRSCYAVGRELKEVAKAGFTAGLRSPAHAINLRPAKERPRQMEVYSHQCWARTTPCGPCRAILPAAHGEWQYTVDANRRDAGGCPQRG